MAADTKGLETIGRARDGGARRGSRKTLRVLYAAAPVLVVAAMTAGMDTDAEPRPPVAPPAPLTAVPVGAAERLAGSLRFATISHADPAMLDSAAFRDFHAYLQAAFPRVHAGLRRETIADYSLLYTWEGSDPSLEPILLAGHQDVVPVEAATAETWQQDPFGGRIADGFVWGRGAIDNKSAVVGTLEAVEMLLAEGFRPARTIYLAYGHDEEVGGTQGAAQIAALLEGRGVSLEMVLDEGGLIGDGIMPGVGTPTALVGIAEKGFVSVELSTRTAGGHSSLPPRQSAIGIVSAAIARLEANPMPARLDGATEQLFETLAPQFPAVRRVTFANLWATRGLVTRKLERAASTNAMVRTTGAATIFQAGTRENVLPGSARAVVNFRILPGDSTGGVLAHVRRVIDDERVEVRQVGSFFAEPALPSRTDSESYRTLERTIRSV